MKSISTMFLASAVFGVASVMGQTTTSEGCFSSTDGMILNGTITFNSKGSCGVACFNANYAVFAMQHFECYCGQSLPPAADSVDASTCNIACPGYPDDICGSASDYSVYLTGLTTSASNINLNSPSPSASAAGGSNGKPSSTSTAKPSVVTVGGQTVVVTAPGETSNVPTGSSKSGSGPNKAAIAAGVVVGVVVFAAIGGALVIFMRNRRRRAIEEEHQRQAAVNNFINEGKRAGGSSAGSFPDMRLDPAVMAQRRMSDGSIADNQDYSRRILKVTNA